MKKITLLSTILAAVGILSSTSAFADNTGYTTGPYLNTGIGVGYIIIPDFIDDGDLKITTLSARAGLGFIGDISHSERPFFAGLEANGNYYNITNSKGASLYGFDASAILGKQLTQHVSLYGKLGGEAFGKEGQFVFGPRVGMGMGYQFTQHIRLTGELSGTVFPAGFISTTAMAGLQFSL